MAPALNEGTLAGKPEVFEPRKLKFQTVRLDPALAPGRQVVRDCLAAPL
jgi:hypothetical protein